MSHDRLGRELKTGDRVRVLGVIAEDGSVGTPKYPDADEVELVEDEKHTINAEHQGHAVGQINGENWQEP